MPAVAAPPCKSISTLRLKVLDAVLRGSVLIGALAVWRGAQDAYGRGAHATAGIILGVYAMLWVGALGRGLSYHLRVACLLGPAMLGGLALLSTIGYLGGPMLMLLGTSTLSAVLLGTRATYAVIGFITLSMVGIGASHATGLVTLESQALFAPTDGASWLRITAVFLLIAHGGAVAVSFVVTRLIDSVDTTRSLVESLQSEMRAREEAETRLRHAEKMEAMGRLSGGIAHDFNNTLTVILGNLEMLAGAEHATSAKRQRFVASAQTAARSASALTQRLLAFSRQSLVRAAPIDVAHTLEDTRLLLSRTLPHGVTFRMTVDDDLPSAVADPNELQQALLNLALNARDAMPDGGELDVHARFAHAVDPNGTQDSERLQTPFVAIDVSDTGSGMERSTQERAFEPFFSTKLGQGGSGLGLAAVASVMQRVGGHVRLNSEPGEGTTVTLLLPAAPGGARVQSAAPSTAAHPRGATLLVAEGEASVRQVMVLTLREAGYRVLEAADGEQALRLQREHGPGLALLCTDAAMPCRDASEVVDAFLTDWPDKPVLVCSGHVVSAPLGPMLERRNVGFLRKPFGPDELKVAVAALLRQDVDLGAAVVAHR